MRNMDIVISKTVMEMFMISSSFLLYPERRKASKVDQQSSDVQHSGTNMIIVEMQMNIIYRFETENRKHERLVEQETGYLQIVIIRTWNTRDCI